MSLDREALEILMGKQLDGEIGAAEARLLQDHLARDPQARQRLNQLQGLHIQSQEALTEALQAKGRPAQDIIESAMRQTRESGRLQWVRNCVCSQFAAGLAAGLLISAGALLVFGPGRAPRPSLPGSGHPLNPAATLHTDQTPDLADGMPQNPHVQRNVDWIMFTDPQGERYLIEGLREARRVQPAVYQGDF